MGETEHTTPPAAGRAAGAQPHAEAREDEFSAAAPPGAGQGSGEASFADADAPAASEPREPAPQEPAPDEAERRAQEYLALAQRTQADFENYRKRMTRETALAAERGVQKLAKELLPALDHLDLALRAAEAEGGSLYEGVLSVQREVVAALGRVGIQPFDPRGELFDPNEHEAMAQQPVEGAESGTVAETYQQGYRINGSVLRPARVVVAA